MKKTTKQKRFQESASPAFREFYVEMSNGWDRKARQLRIRRERALKRAMRSRFPF